MKFIGAILIICAALSSGINRNKLMQKGIHIKRDILFSLEIIKSELATSRSTLPEMLKTAMKACGGEVGEFYKAVYECLTDGTEKNFSEIWQNGISSLSSIDQSSREALLRLGQSLGRYETEEQLRETENCCALIKNVMSAEAEEYNKVKKSNLALPTVTAAILVIVLI